MAIHTAGDISLFNTDGSSILCNHENATFTSTTVMLDGSCIARDGMDQQPVGASGQIEFTVLVNKTGGPALQRLKAADVSFALGAQNYDSAWTTLDLDLIFKTVSQKGARDYNARNQPTKKGYTGNITLNAYAGIAKAVMTAAYSKVAADKTTTFNVTLDGTLISIPAKISTAKLSYERDGVQTVAVTIEGSDPGTGAYPTAPVTTDGLLSKAFNAWKDPLPFAWQSHTVLADGLKAAGFMTFNNVKISSKGDDFVRISYVFDTYGDVTPS